MILTHTGCLLAVPHGVEFPFIACCLSYIRVIGHVGSLQVCYYRKLPVSHADSLNLILQQCAGLLIFWRRAGLKQLRLTLLIYTAQQKN